MKVLPVSVPCRARRAAVILLAGLLAAGSGLEAASAQDGPVAVLSIENEAITPVVTRYLERGLREARETGVQAVVIELDTPGGLMESTQQIVRSLVESPLPVIVYVSPSGGRAASAGVFITLSAHVAAMAPGTHIGAAHPVSLGGGAPGTPSTDPDTAATPEVSGPSDVMGEKVVNDAVAWARSLAELRERNADWAARAVSESSSITAAEAARDGVVDLVATNRAELLERIDGRAVVTTTDSVALATSGAEIRELPMWWGERVLGAVSNPNVAFLLMVFGFYGLLFELYTAGWGVGGTVGAICLVLAAFGLSVLPINFAGLALIVLGLGLLVAEAFVTSYGTLTIGGALCMVFGALMLVDTPVEMMQVSASIAVPVALATSAIAFFLVSSAIRAHRAPVHTGSSGMIGERAVASTSFEARGDRYEGMVRTHGELWSARSAQAVEKGEELRVVAREGLTLEVERSDGRSPPEGAR